MNMMSRSHNERFDNKRPGKERLVVVGNGMAGIRTVEYDRLLLATGSDPFIIPGPGRDLPGVVTFRDMFDVEAMLKKAADGGKHAVVIGAGLLGLEAA